VDCFLNGIISPTRKNEPALKSNKSEYHSLFVRQTLVDRPQTLLTLIAA